jgi:hypothetical protein
MEQPELSAKFDSTGTRSGVAAAVNPFSVRCRRLEKGRTMRTISAIFAMLAAISVSTAARAQSTDVPFLAGLRSFTIAIADLDDEDETSCGLTSTGLYTSLRSVLGRSDIVVTDDARTRDGIIYLQVTVLSNCTANIALNVQTSVTVNKTGARIFAPVWERERLRTGLSRRSAGAAIRESVESVATTLVDDWNSVNP